MRHLQTIFVSEAEIELTESDVLTIYNCARQHYDAVCRNAVIRGGTVYGLLNRCGRDGSGSRHKALEPVARFTTVLEWRELDLLCKICEYNPENKMHTNLLHEMFRLTLRRMREVTPESVLHDQEPQTPSRKTETAS